MIVALTDLSPRSDETLRVAARLAGSGGAELHVVHALDVIGRSLREAIRPLHEGLVPRAEDALRAQIRRSLPEHPGPVHATLDPRHPVRAVTDVARQARAHLVVVGAGGGRRDRETGMGYAEEVARRTPVAVLVAGDPSCWPPRRLRPLGEEPEGQELATWSRRLGVPTAERYPSRGACGGELCVVMIDDAGTARAPAGRPDASWRSHPEQPVLLLPRAPEERTAVARPLEAPRVHVGQGPVPVPPSA